MSRAARSIQAFGLYMLLEGLVLLLVPGVLLGLLGLPETSEVWIRVAGIAVLVLSYYYLMAARLNLTAFFPLTVPTRVFQFLAFGAFVLLGLVGWQVMLPAAVELGAGLWTAWALRQPGLSPSQAI